MSTEKLTYADIENELVPGKVLSAEFIKNVFKTVFDVTDKLCESPAEIQDGTGNWLDIVDGKFVYHKIQGERGEAGPRGEKGETGMAYRFQGEYSEADTYTCDERYVDAVRHNGNLYVCRANGISGIPPTDSDSWALMVERGERGERGRDAVVNEAAGMVYFSVSADGDLLVHCNDDTEASHFHIENGELIYRIE